MENQLYFTKNHLQGENNVEEDNFLKIYNIVKDKCLKISEPPPNMFDMIDTPLHFDKRSKKISAQNNKEQDASSSQVPSIMELELGGE